MVCRKHQKSVTHFFGGHLDGVNVTPDVEFSQLGYIISRVLFPCGGAHLFACLDTIPGAVAKQSIMRYLASHPCGGAKSPKP